MKNIQRLELPAAADMHVHLRQGDMMDLVVPTVRQGGVDTAFVITVLEYKAKLTAITQDVNFLMSLYVSFNPPYTTSP
ncbi:hypothetical protein LB505_001287 [Fusarium chuoi]|nr:hypothetical protein LB505_001287 [Fusarium chuoi]